MLYKNGQKYNMTVKEKKDLREKFTFPISLLYAKNLIKPNKLNALPDRPAGINIPLRSVVSVDGTSVEWRWAKTETLNHNREAKYTPRVIPFQGNWSISDLDLDLLFFLYHYSPYCDNGALEDRQKKSPFFEIEDLVQLATDKVKARRMESRVRTLIDDPDMGLPESELRMLASAYFIPNQSKLTLDQVRVALDLEVRKDSKQGNQRFLEMSNSKELIEVRGKIRNAIDLGIVILDPKNRTWQFINEDKTKESICKINKMDPQTGLSQFYSANAEFKDRLDAELEGRYATTNVEPVKEEN